MRSTSLGRKGPSGASRLRFLGFLVATPSGRYLTVSVLLLLASLLIWRQALISWLGLGIVPVGTWFAVFLYLAVSSPGRIIRAWQIMAGAFAGAIAATGLLGMFNHPFETVLGQVTTGGHLGRLLARAPFEWPGDGPGIAHLLLASLRVAGVAAIAGAVLWPFQAFRVANMVAQLAAATSVFVAHAFQAARVHLAERTERRRRAREDARLAALAAVETEASLMENPCITVTQPRTRKLADESMTEEQECNAPAPSDAAAATRAPEIAGTVAVTPSPGLPGHERMGAISRPAAVPPRPQIPNYNWKLPGLDLLKLGRPPQIPQAEIEATSDLIVETLAEHGVDVKITQITAGPVVTMYGIAPGWERSRYKPGRNDSKWEDEEANRKRVRVDTILAREKDLALALASPNIRFESPIPGESLVGIEVPNAHPSLVTLRSVMQDDSFRDFEKKAALPIALGIASSSGEVFADLTKMPHLLVAGATGSGKSVCMNTIITGFMLTRNPTQVQMILIDPKRVELTPYAGVPHLACPPVVEADRAVLVLKAVVKEMMARYAMFESAGAKNIAAYNDKAGAGKLPYLVVAVDELADLMLTSANEVERLIVRLAQLGRATGVHLIVATQRPSVDVVTGLIKANFPSRIAFAVSAQVDSRTILDSNGAERLLGRGDMLFLPIDRPKPMRVQGAFLTDSEVEATVRFWRSSGGPRMPELKVEEPQHFGEGDDDSGGSGEDMLFSKAQELAQTQSRLSTSLLQRRLRIGYPRAARLMDELEEAGIVGPGELGKPRQVLVH